MKKSSWKKNNIKNNFSSSYYDFGILNFYDHKLEEKIILKYVGDGGVCLDLAGGTGRFTGSLVSKKCIVTLVDLEDKHIKAAKEQFSPKKVECLKMDALEFVKITKNKYDFIIVSGLLLFLTENEVSKLLNDLRDMLNINGVLLVRDFLSKKENVEVNSKVFSNTKLYYRPKKFYTELGAEEFKLSRPLHLLPKIEEYIMGKLGFSVYHFIQGSHIYKKISWIPAKYENTIFIIRKYK